MSSGNFGFLPVFSDIWGVNLGNLHGNLPSPCAWYSGTPQSIVVLTLAVQKPSLNRIGSSLILPGLGALWKCLGFYERSRAANPLQVAIVVNAHHLAATHTNQGHDRGHFASLRPYIHDANLRLSAPLGGVDHRGEAHSFLQDVVVTLGRGDCGKLLVGGGEHDAGASKRVERLKQVVLAIGWDGCHVIKEPGLGHTFMPQVRNRKLADP